MPAAHDAASRHKNPLLEDAPKLYRHSKREEWGLAVLRWEQPGKRCYGFEDGQERVLKEGFYELMVEVPSGEATIRSPQSKWASEPKAALVTRKVASDPTFEELLAAFLGEFPGGFEDSKWLREQRGVMADRPLKRHREPVIAKVSRLWAGAALKDLVDSGQSKEVHRRLLDGLRATDLVPEGQLKILERAVPSRELATASYLLLHGTQEVSQRFDLFLAALSTHGVQATWILLTAPWAVFAPKHHVFVRPNVWAPVIRVIVPGFRPSATASSRQYGRYLEASCLLRDKLTEAGRAPRDHLDVFDFAQTATRLHARTVAVKTTVAR